MSVIGFSAKLAARLYKKKIDSWKKNAVALQEKEFNQLIRKGMHTSFGEDHSFTGIKTYDDFRKNVPLRDYEAISPYIKRAGKGEKNVLWPGRPKYFAKTSGTTSGDKYIPITGDSMPNHINSTRYALLNYINSTGKTAFLDGNYIFLSWSPKLEDHNGILTGRLSGIVNHHVPNYLKKRQLPSWEVNCITDWEKKLDAVVDETIDKNMSLISGIPPWVEMYFEKLLERSGKPAIPELFPGFRLFVYGGVNFKPYEQKFRLLAGDNIDLLEIFPASEGFLAFQDEFPSSGLLLIPDAGIFYEFIPIDKFLDGEYERIQLADVKTGVSYVIILNTNAGMWGYNIGDTVEFVSTDPYRIIVTGRVGHFISAFGEHVIAEEVESAIGEACEITGAGITEFTVAPLTENPGGRPCHEWLIEFSDPPPSMEDFSRELEMAMRNKNSDYNDLIEGKIMQPLVIREMPQKSFANYMDSIGKLGGQSKVPHLKNDRDMADALYEYL